MSVLNQEIKKNIQDVEKTLDILLTTPDTPEARVKEAMRYGVFNGGKRLRPFLLLNTAKLFNANEQNALFAAAALEMIHSYSLVHDDLPSMDDDDIRRGKPTCHIKYDEVTAILAGDGLLTKAFEVLSDERTHKDANIRIKLVEHMSKAAGGLGMVGGQMLDLMADTLPPLSLDDITRLQAMKTGRLISVACEAGAIIGNATKDEYEALCKYAKDIGLAFQIADDLLDVEGTLEEMGKAVGKDQNAGKATFVSLLGVEKAKNKALELVENAKNELSIFGDKAFLLKEVADYIITRRN